MEGRWWKEERSESSAGGKGWDGSQGHEGSLWISSRSAGEVSRAIMSV